MELDKTMRYSIAKSSRQKFGSVRQDAHQRNKKISKPRTSSMKTADKIISVEDEKMLLAKRRKNISASDEMSVMDIVTLEDEGKVNKIEEIINEDRNKKNSNYNEIDKKKILKIEEASFEDVMRVANIRLEAEKNAEKRKKLKEKSNSSKQSSEIFEQENDGKMKDEGKNIEVKKSGRSVPTSDISDAQSELSSLDIKTSEEEKNSEDIGVNNSSDEKLDGKVSDSEESSPDNGSENTKEDKSEGAENTLEEISSEDTDDKEQDTLEESVEIYEDSDGGGNGGLKKFFKRFLMVVVAVLILAYIAGCAYFKGRFYPNTTVNGINVSYKTPAELDKLAEEKLNGYELHIRGREGVKDVVQGDDVDLEYVADGSSSKIKEEQGYLTWPISYLTSDKIDGKLNLKLDDKKLKNVVLALNIFDKKNIKEPVKQHQAFSEKEDKFVLDPGTLGSIPVEKNVINFVSSELKKESTDVSYSPDSYTKSEYDPVDKHMEAAIENINKHIDQKISYDFEYEKYNVTKEDLGNMYSINKDDKYKVELNKDNVRNFVRKLSRKYSTYGDTREFYSASKEGMLKVSGGFYGWLIDREKETDALYDIVKSGKNVSDRKPIYYQTAMSRQKNDLGNEYIEIDLSKQYMWYVKDKEVLVSTPIVSGMPGAGDATPSGIYPINYKTRNATLRGPGYASPVSYWIPFNGNIGIHDASWQPFFGGNRYLYAGSHGCINTPYSKVAQIYNLAKEGLPVIVHH